MEIRCLTSVISTIFFILAAIQVKAQQNFRAYHCEAKQNYTDSSGFETNLRHVLSSLPYSSGNGYGFFNLSSGAADRVHTTALCRGDVDPATCRSCIREAAEALPKTCPHDREAVLWLDLCMLRYAGRALLGKWNPNRKNIFSASKNLSFLVDFGSFEKSLSSLLHDLMGWAAVRSTLKFAAGNASGSGYTQIYALVQCTPDLSTEDCINCLGNAFDEIPEWFHGNKSGPEFMKNGARVDGTSCSFRYDTSLFYNLLTNGNEDASLEPSSTNNNTTEEGLNPMLIFVVSSALVVVVVIVISVCVCLRIKRKKKTVTKAGKFVRNAIGFQVEGFVSSITSTEVAMLFKQFHFTYDITLKAVGLDELSNRPSARNVAFNEFIMKQAPMCL